MGNHFHLLLRTEKEDLSQILKRLAGRYVYWYNLKYRRSGHLFQDRFKSEAVDDDRYFIALLRYIHQNPVKAGLCNNVADFMYSSYGDYFSSNSELLDIDYVFSIIDRESFISMNNEMTDDLFLDVDCDQNRINDPDAMALIQSISGCKNAAEFQSLDNEKREKHLKELRAKGLSIRQISRLTGVSFGIVRKF